MKSVDILLVEDNEGDILLTTEAFEDSRLLNKMEVVRDGKQALDYLYGKAPYQDKPKPRLILLDINLPRKNGHEVLQTIKADPQLRSIPVIMLATSSAEKDISLSYQYHANCYISKPVEIDSFLQAIRTIHDFWLNVVALPPD